MKNLIVKTNEELKNVVKELLQKGVEVRTIYGDIFLNENLEVQSHEDGTIYNFVLDSWEKAEISGNDKRQQVYVF